MIYLLDTDLLVFMVRGLKAASRPKSRQQAVFLRQQCQKVQAAGDSVGLSAVTVSELEFGAQYSERYETEITAVRKVLTPFDVFAYDAIASPAHYGRIRHELESKGQTIGSMDLLIAAHALALDATLVTNNDAHFRRVVGLRVLNWLTAPSPPAGSGT
jgi:tRNA(fMet)-specific endonuclease VapC